MILHFYEMYYHKFMIQSVTNQIYKYYLLHEIVNIYDIFQSVIKAIFRNSTFEFVQTFYVYKSFFSRMTTSFSSFPLNNYFSNESSTFVLLI